MDAPVDIATTAAVRRVFVRHWIDLGQLSLRASRGLVHITGQLDTVPEAQEKLDPFVIADLFTEIQHIPSVKRVSVSLINWAQSGDQWQPTGPMTPTGSPFSPLPPAAA